MHFLYVAICPVLIDSRETELQYEHSYRHCSINFKEDVKGHKMYQFIIVPVLLRLLYIMTMITVTLTNTSAPMISTTGTVTPAINAPLVTAPT